MVQGVMSRQAAAMPRRQGLGIRVLALIALLYVTGCAVDSNQQTPSSAGRDITTSSDESEQRKRARIRLELATGYFSQGKVTTALDELKQSISIDSGISEAYSLRGVIYDALGDDELAEDSFKRALSLDHANSAAMQNYGWFFCKRKRYVPADEWLAKAVATPQNPSLAQALMVRGVCQTRAGRLDDAKASLLRAYEIEPANPAIGTNLTNVLYRRGEYDRARFYIRRVNSIESLVNAETLWLALRIERRLHNTPNEAELAGRLHSLFPNSREAAALDAGRYEE